jgi:tetratricopeptide (TPR) repeat protein
MPKIIKKRIAKKTGLKEEQVKSAVDHFKDAMKKRKRISGSILAALGVAVISAVLFFGYSFSVNKKAYSVEKEAFDYYYNIGLKPPVADEERYKKSLELFKKRIEIKPAPVAQFYVGNCYFNLGDYDSAIKSFKEFIDTHRDNEEVLPLVYQKLVSAYFKKGKNDEAIKTLETLAQFKNGFFKDNVLILTARYYESAGNTDEAMKKYKELIKDFPDSIWVREAQGKIGPEEPSKPPLTDKGDGTPDQSGLTFPEGRK